jgi:hypothetical protein
MSEIAEVYWCTECREWDGQVGSYNKKLDKYTCYFCSTPLETFVAVAPAKLERMNAVIEAAKIQYISHCLHQRMRYKGEPCDCVQCKAFVSAGFSKEVDEALNNAKSI